MIASTLSGKLAIKHPSIGILCREDGLVFNVKSGRYRSHGYTAGSPIGTGYMKIQKDRRNFLVHRLIAEAFIPNPNSLSQVDHINRCKSDNRVSNLRWVTLRENMTNRDDVDRSISVYGIRWCDNKKEYDKAHRSRCLALKTPDGRNTRTGALPDSLYNELEPLTCHDRFVRYYAWLQSQKE